MVFVYLVFVHKFVPSLSASWLATKAIINVHGAMTERQEKAYLAARLRELLNELAGDTLRHSDAGGSGESGQGIKDSGQSIKTRPGAF
jgi:hypothetical protein